MCRPQVFSLQYLLLLTPRVYSAHSAQTLSQKVNADRCFRHSVLNLLQTGKPIPSRHKPPPRPSTTHSLTYTGTIQRLSSRPFLPKTLVCVRQLLYWEVRAEVNMYTDQTARSKCTLCGHTPHEHRYQGLMRSTNPCGSSHIRIKKVFEPQASSQ